MNKKKENKICLINIPLQSCLLCGEKISVLPGTHDALCKNCGFKDPCCE